ncbi:hypothetical protein [Desulfosporosinus youngiae]|uniref:hypothetical protein n=1 Tax=Desulfosporosinus youngiae TaxID=339862 RepID=UPI0002E37E45
MAKKITKIDPVKQQITLQLQPKKRVCAYCRVSSDSLGTAEFFHRPAGVLSAPDQRAGRLEIRRDLCR